MKKLTIKFSFEEKSIKKDVFLNNDINADEAILADTSANNGVTAECGMAEELGIWEITFSGQDGTMFECDFKAILNEDDSETLTLNPAEVFVWSSETGKSLFNGTLPFEVTVE